MDFERDTQVTLVGSSTYEALLSKDWEIWGPNGGYLCAIALRAVGHEAQIKRPIALYCHYLKVAQFAAVQLASRCSAAPAAASPSASRCTKTVSDHWKR